MNSTALILPLALLGGCSGGKGEVTTEANLNNAAQAIEAQAKADVDRMINEIDAAANAAANEADTGG